MLASRILILAPHPDDETVGCAAAIGRARAAGSRLFVMTLTTGVPPPEQLWPWQRACRSRRIGRRLIEARHARQVLGVAAAGQLDVSSRTLRRHLRLASAAALQAAVDCRAEMLWVPAYEGGHQDHDAANAIGASLTRHLQVWEFAEYNFAGGQVRCQEFPDPRGQTVSLFLDAVESTAKQAALDLYASERANLRHVGCQRECFRPLASYDYRRPPHEGPLFYERFRWVPFPHPRIDRTTALEVSRDLAGFVIGSSA